MHGPSFEIFAMEGNGHDAGAGRMAKKNDANRCYGREKRVQRWGWVARKPEKCASLRGTQRAWPHPARIASRSSAL